MELTRFIDDYADDIYALALITTKNFDSAKEIFVRLYQKAIQMLQLHLKGVVP